MANKEKEIFIDNIKKLIIAMLRNPENIVINLSKGLAENEITLQNLLDAIREKNLKSRFYAIKALGFFHRLKSNIIRNTITLALNDTSRLHQIEIYKTDILTKQFSSIVSFFETSLEESDIETKFISVYALVLFKGEYNEGFEILQSFLDNKLITFDQYLELKCLSDYFDVNFNFDKFFCIEN